MSILDVTEEEVSAKIQENPHWINTALLEYGYRVIPQVVVDYFDYIDLSKRNILFYIGEKPLPLMSQEQLERLYDASPKMLDKIAPYISSGALLEKLIPLADTHSLFCMVYSERFNKDYMWMVVCRLIQLLNQNTDPEEVDLLKEYSQVHPQTLGDALFVKVISDPQLLEDSYTLLKEKGLVANFRRPFATNPETPLSVLRQIAEEDDQLWNSVARHANADAPLVELVMSNPDKIFSTAALTAALKRGDVNPRCITDYLFQGAILATASGLSVFQQTKEARRLRKTCGSVLSERRKELGVNEGFPASYVWQSLYPDNAEPILRAFEAEGVPLI